MRPGKKTAVVVGGGFAGCTITHMLTEKGFDVTLLEGSSVLGGGQNFLLSRASVYLWAPPFAH